MMKQHITIAVIATFIISIVIGVAQVAATSNRIIALPTPQRQALQVSGQVTPWGVVAAGLHDVPAVYVDAYNAGPPKPHLFCANPYCYVDGRQF